MEKFEVLICICFGWVMCMIFVLCVLLLLVYIWFNMLFMWLELWILVIYFVGFVMICVLWYFVLFCWCGSKVVLVFDVLLVLLVLVCLIYLMLVEDVFYECGVKFVISDWVFLIFVILIVMEMICCIMGWFIFMLILICLIYVLVWGKWVGGIFYFFGLSVEILLYCSFYFLEGMFGLIVVISWSFVFMFILFGVFLVCFGVGDYIMDVLCVVVGKVVGGFGFIVVLVLGLMGLVFGFSVVNMVFIGVIIIFMMKKVGFFVCFVVGVEVVVLTGG